MTIFGVIPAGLPLITEPSSVPSPTTLLYSLPSEHAFSHLVVFILPNTNLPPGTAASIYLATAAHVAAAEERGAEPDFKFLGAIGPGKESAMFKVKNNDNSAPVDEEVDASTVRLVVGVSIEAEAEVVRKLQELAERKTASATATQQPQQPSTTVLAQRIIQNAFNFLTGFSGTAGPGGVEVVPLKAFEDWWRKFENRVRNDPSFLEKQSD